MQASVYELRYTRRALKDLKKLDGPIRGRVMRRIEKLAEDPRPHGSKVLTDAPPFLRVREGDIRIKYAIKEGPKIVTIARVLPRDTVYKHR